MKERPTIKRPIMEREKLLLLMDLTMMVTGLTAIKKEMVSTDTPMVLYMKDNLLMT